MTTADERLRVLRMVRDGQVTAEEAAQLLAALTAPAGERRLGAETGQARWVRVRVTDTTTGKVKISVGIPAGLVDVGLKMGARFAPALAGLDLAAVQAAIKGGVQGKILEVADEEDHECVEIFVE